MMRCKGCGEWGTAANSCGVYYYICDCGTITTLPDFRDVWRAHEQINRKEEKKFRRFLASFGKGAAE